MTIKKAALISAVSKYSTVLGTLLFTMILSRILTPEDYGITAIIGVFTTFFSLLSDMGIGNGIVQNKDLDKNDLRNIFTFTIISGIILAIIFIACGYPISYVYHNKCYLYICPLLSISILANTINTVPKSVLLKEKKFLLIGIRNLVIMAVSMSVAVIFAKLGFKYYALVFQSVIASLAELFWNFSSVPFLPGKKHIRMSLNKIRDFSKYVLAYNFMNYYVRNLDNLLIGAFMGNTMLGYYDKSYKLMGYPMQYLTHAITPVFQPILSDYQTDIPYVYQTYLKVTGFLSAAGLFISVACFFMAEEIIVLFFGAQWEIAVPCFRVLSVSLWPQIVYASVGAVFISLNRSDELFKTGCYEAVVMIICILAGLSFKKLTMVASFVSLGLVIRFFLNYYMLIKRVMKKSFANFLQAFTGDLITGAIMCMAVAAGTAFYQPDSMLKKLVLKLFLCASGYLAGTAVRAAGKHAARQRQKIR